MAILKLRGALKEYLWGGRRLIDEYNKKVESDILAETWELSCYPDSPSVIIGKDGDGMALSEYIEANGRGILGTNCDHFRDFPVLIKFIDAAQDLSVQVHPSDEYALKNEGQYGKSEMWYIIDAAEGALLYFGFQKEITKEEFKRRIEDNTIMEVLNAVPVRKGDVFFIEAGTIHAIGKGILLAEIQQNSNVTYRVYDYARRDKDGNTRELHIDKALDVTSLCPPRRQDVCYPHLAKCEYFTVDKIDLDGKMTDRLGGNATDESFIHFLFLDGEGEVTSNGESLSFKKGDSIFITAGSGEYEIRGRCEALMTSESR